MAPPTFPAGKPRIPVKAHEAWKPPPDCTFPVCDHVEHVKQEWESTADALPQLVCLLNAAGDVMRCNQTVERWGLGRVTEVKGMCLHALLHPDCAEPDCHLAHFWTTACAGLRHGLAASHQAEDLRLHRYLDIQVRPHAHRVGAHAGLQEAFATVVVSDISELKAAERGLHALTHELEQRVVARTAQLAESNRQLRQEIMDREQAEESLRHSRDEYRQLVETMNEGLAVQDTENHITYVNERLARMLGYAVEDILGHKAEDFIDASCREAWNDYITRRRQGDINAYELILRGRGGKRVWTKVSPNLILGRRGEYAGSFAVITDISDRVRAEEALRNSERVLRQLSAEVLSSQEKERQRIASELHDGIGQTLSAIKFYVENALLETDRPHNEQTAQRFHDIIPKLQAAIEEVRRISMDLRPSILDDLSILATLGWFCREYQVVYAGITIKLRTEIAEADIPVPLKVVIFRIVQEALNNIAKHAKTDTVRITLCETPHGIELDIADNGIGFDLEEIAAKRGSGLGGTGLVSMRERAEYSGGRFSLRSRKGEGTAIRIRWPDASNAS